MRASPRPLASGSLPTDARRTCSSSRSSSRSPRQIVSRSPRTRPTTSRSPETCQGPRPRVRRAVEFQTPPLRSPDPAFEVWLPLPTFLAAIPMAIVGARRSPRPRSRRSSSARSSRSWPGGWRRRRRGARAAGRAGTDAGGRSRPDDRRLPAAAAPLGTARLHDAVHGARPGCVPADDPHRCGSDWRAAIATRGSSRSGLAIGLAALTRNEAIWLGLVWAGARLVHAAAARRRRVRLIGVVAVVAVLVFAPWAIRNWRGLRQPVAGPGRRRTRCRSPASTSSPGTTRRRSRATSPWAGPASSSCASRVSPTTCSTCSCCSGSRSRYSAWRACHGPGVVASARSLVLSRLTFLFTSLIFPAATTGAHSCTVRDRSMSCCGQRPVRAGRPIASDRATPRMDVSRGVARADCSASSGRRSSRSFCCPRSRRPRPGPPGLFQASSPVRMAAAGHPLDASAGRSSRTSRFGWPRPTHPDAGAPQRAAERRARHGQVVRRTRLLVLIEPQGKHWPADLEAGVPGSECFRPIDLGPWTGAAGSEDP